ncbi:exopolyphosphatase [Leuconostoc rapi]|uniref:Ppx/GppA phosphatase family protein n=1 Tax=Leuconostoc rapi TaxID=1406906 RepID=UPI00195A6A77|nr:exopolyphosphatase [Leuconostoc rapi]MBM7436270.1 exopolyphosphatase/guanosine-5'-triphosphate,3'-diphosphate pyrophosphatase [Leuconostoc rapi]
MSYLAIVDLGSNSARMVVEELHDDGTYTEIVREKQDTRIAQNMGPELTLKEEPIARTIETLKYFKTKYVKFNPELRAITTAAVRMATNQKAFLARVELETGIVFQVLSGKEEAYYDYLGVVSTLAITDAVILDTGGASVELIAMRSGKNIDDVSLPFGAVSLSERFKLANNVNPLDIENACKNIFKQYQTLSWLPEQRGLPVVLLGGANRSLARMGRTALGKVTVNNFHGFNMTIEKVSAIFEKISHMTREQRENIAGLESARADIIISGLLPLLTLMRIIDAPKVIFSESGVREGLIAETIKNNG